MLVLLIQREETIHRPRFFIKVFHKRDRGISFSPLY